MDVAKGSVFMKFKMSEIKESFDDNEVNKRKLVLSLLGISILAVSCLVLSLFTGSGTGQNYPVYINEVVASNSSYPNPDGRCCDYIEIFNGANYPVDLTGFQLGDIAGKQRYIFPYGTVLEPGSYYVIYCDSTVEDRSYAPFGISRSGGEMFYLIGSSNAIVDQMTTIPSDMDQSMIRLEDGSWIISDQLTPGISNDSEGVLVHDIYNAAVSSVRFSEVSTVGTGFLPEFNVFCDWVELHNTGNTDADVSGYILSDNPGNDKFVFPEGTVIKAGEYLLIYCTTEITDSSVAPFNLSQLGGEALVLKNDNKLIVERIETVSMVSGSQILTDDHTWQLTNEPSPGYENSNAGHAAFVQEIGAEPGTILISEVLAKNMAYLPDGDGDFSDWIELYNAGAQPVNLKGWYLSDNSSDPEKWSFPDFEIHPGERKILFCSGKGTVANDEVHTNFTLAATGESLTLSTYLGITMDTVTFGQAETNQSFVFESDAVLHFVPTPGYPNTEDGYHAFSSAASASAPLAIWEVMVDNDSYLPQSLGKCYDWVELRNISDSDVNLSDYTITDDPDVPNYFNLPDVTLAPGKTITIILSGDVNLSNKKFHHGSFSLNAAEDQLLLYKNGETLVDYVYLKDIPYGMSYGRQNVDGGFSYMEPTPQNPNIAGYRLISTEPVCQQYAPGVYTSESTVEVALDADGAIYYTLDGSIPTAKSISYTDSVQISETCTFRAISVEEGKLASEILTLTFVINEPHDIPVMSLTVNPENLWGKDGVYKDWDLSVKEIPLPANVAYSGPDGSFSIDCEFGMHGATSLKKFDKKSFHVKFKDVYDGTLHYDVFGDGEVMDFSSLVIRSPIESTYTTHMHDSFIAEVCADYCDTVIPMKNKFVALYLNGEYWGLYCLREHHTEAHYASYMNVPVDTVTMVRYASDHPDFYDLYKFMDKNSLKSDKNYARATEMLDITSFADWIILEAYMCNIDINTNMRYYYSSADGLWRCGLVDLDLGMTGSHKNFEGVVDAWHHGVIVEALMQNDQFKDYISKRLVELLSGPMSDENMVARANAMADEIRNEVVIDCERWKTPVHGWERFFKEMLSYCEGGERRMVNSLAKELGYSQSQKQAYFGDFLK